MANPDNESSHRRRQSTVESPPRSRGDKDDIDPWDSISQQDPRDPRRIKRKSSSRKSSKMQSTESSSRRRHRSDLDRSHRRRRTDDGYVYRRRSDDMSIISEEPREKKIKVIYVKEGHKSRGKGTEVSVKPLRRSSTSATRRRSDTVRREERPPLKRSQSSRSSRTPYESSVRDTKRSSFLGSWGFFGSTPKTPPEPPKPPRMVQCSTCLDDEVPRSKTAKLECGHRMCQECMIRLFELSVKDPAHMPPKCCTSEHIPLKHVEKLFDTKFKILWNRKFQEYTTKNRIYCPARRCGEWIKPGSIHTEGGRKYGKCARCKTKVCCLCNAKWHGSKECPKDEATNALLEAAKQAGWQRCYNCRTMVELKEGCNHMTCRCNAQFCMICGSKWKTCNCPWFNYETVEADRINHMRVPRQPRGYDEELGNRRRQEVDDEILARRMARVGIENYNDDGLGDIHGVGILDHHMNETYRRPIPRPQAQAAAQYAMNMPLRRAEPQARARVRDYNAAARPSDRLVPARTRRGYAAEAAVHAPIQLPDQNVRPAELAGIARGARGSDRVGTWAHYVLPTAPPEGVISTV